MKSIFIRLATCCFLINWDLCFIVTEDDAGEKPTKRRKTGTATPTAPAEQKEEAPISGKKAAAKKRKREEEVAAMVILWDSFM